MPAHIDVGTLCDHQAQLGYTDIKTRDQAITAIEASGCLLFKLSSDVSTNVMVQIRYARYNLDIDTNSMSGKQQESRNCVGE